jgi:radical SAM superfamily enzyme YgiQ (UPF0313 family)
MPHILLINPAITTRRNARFPLAVLTLAAALEGKYATTVIDGNVDDKVEATVLRRLARQNIGAVAITVMGGPQLPTAIRVSQAIKARFPAVPIIWGGYFPTNCPEPSIRAPYVDFVVRGQGDVTLYELLDALLPDQQPPLGSIAGLTWQRENEIVHNADRPFSAATRPAALTLGRLKNPQQYLGRTYLGRHTAGYQAALGCRFHCTFCGVARMFRGKTALPTATRLEQDMECLTRLGADSVVFYDNNFFDREVEMPPLLQMLAKHRLPWWCFARSDALLNLSEASWSLVRKSRLRMAYIGAESPSDWLLHDTRKGTRSDQTLAAVEVCRVHGVIPELSFMLAPPEDPEGETEKTFEYIRRIKKLHPATEIMLYVYTPLAPSPHNADAQRSPKQYVDVDGQPVVYPTTADEWAQPQWVNYWCHQDAPWLSDRLRQRILDFTTVLGCRFPTITDIRSPGWAKSALRAAAAWRYQFQRYGHPWELDLSKRLVRQFDPRATGL